MEAINHRYSGKASEVFKTIVCFCFFISIVFLAGKSTANNVRINGTTVSADYKVRFTISWDNSWRRTVPPYSRDAVWLFVKYAACSSGVQIWKHAPLSTNAADDSTATRMEIIPSLNSDGTCKGVYLQRSSTNAGGTSNDSNNTYIGCRLQLAASFPSGTYNFKVYGIEMVYIPQNDFQVGDGVAPTFNSRTVGVGDEISGNATANWLYTGNPAVPAAYPVGWSSFYCMKYEISQEEYADFLNVLTYDQQATRTIVAPNSAAGSYALIAAGADRNGIRIQTPGDATTTPKTPAVYWCDLSGNGTGNESTDGQNIACNHLSWADVAAYLDWACLRPMSELEYEKVCRGTVARVAAEYPWGLAARWLTTWGNCSAAGANIVVANSGSLNLAGQAGENSTATGNGLCAVVGGTGPLRVGFAATTVSTTRALAGTSYYGVLDMGGNLWERTVAVNTDGLVFNRDSLGDGAIDSTATWQANVGTWPSVTTASGVGFRGGAWNTACQYTETGYQYPYVRTSDRTAATSVLPARASTYGGRGVRNP